MTLKRKLSRLSKLNDPPPTLFSPSPDQALGHTTNPPPTWPFTVEPTDSGLLHRALTTFLPNAHHGRTALARALDATPRSVSTLALDSSLTHFDPQRALYLDTETTGLSGGTGTIAFLIGLGWFDHEQFTVEQLFVPAPGEETPALDRVAERLSWATSIVTFNGKSFDLPLLNTRRALNHGAVLHSRPHLDLLHVSRRIYRARTADCALITLERDVLEFTRQNDLASAQVPDQWLRFVHHGDRTGLVAVARHNLWDVTSLAALTGELSSRLENLPANGRLEDSDLIGLARTSLRAGQLDLAQKLTSDLLDPHTPHSPNDTQPAHLIAAEIHRRRKDPATRSRHLLDALALRPDDPKLHLDLARCFERDLNDPHTALHHARLATGAENPATLARRVHRLEARLRAGLQLRLPGVA